MTEETKSAEGEATAEVEARLAQARRALLRGDLAEAQEMLTALRADLTVKASPPLQARVEELENDHRRLANQRAKQRARRLRELRLKASRHFETGDLSRALSLQELALKEAFDPQLSFPKEVQDLIGQMLKLENLHTDQTWAMARQLIDRLRRVEPMGVEAGGVSGLAEQWIHWARQRDLLGVLLSAIRHAEYSLALQIAKEHRAEYPEEASFFAPIVKRELRESIDRSVGRVMVAAREALQDAQYEPALKRLAEAEARLVHIIEDVEGLLPDQEESTILRHYEAEAQKLRVQAEDLKRLSRDAWEKLEMARWALDKDDLAAAYEYLDLASAADRALREPRIRKQIEDLRQQLAERESKRLEEAIHSAQERLSQAKTENELRAVQISLEALAVDRLGLPAHNRVRDLRATVASALDAWRKSQGLVQNGRKALDQGSYSEAISFFRAALASQPENTEARLLLDDSEREWQRQAWLESVVAEGQRLLRAQKYADAVVLLEPAVGQARHRGMEPTSDQLASLLHTAEAGAKLESGRRLLSSEKYEEAESDILQALTLSENHVPAAGIAVEAEELLLKIRAKVAEFRDRERTHTFVQKSREALNDGDIEAAIQLLRQAESILIRYSRTDAREAYNE